MSVIVFVPSSDRDGNGEGYGNPLVIVSFNLGSE